MSKKYKPNDKILVKNYNKLIGIQEKVKTLVHTLTVIVPYATK
jgi:hypothetical protein